jgi:tryptophan halogenase
MPSQLKNFVIVGGGSAGWMTAAALSSLLDPKDVSITVVESDQIGTIGVGEATIPHILNFNALLGIPEDEFMRATQATFKLGIEFRDWRRLGDAYIHPFSNHGADMHGISFHQFWLQTRAHGNEHPIQDYSMCAMAAMQNKFVLPDPNPRSVLSQIRYAYHFDASLYAAFLRKYAEKRGVRRIEGKVDQVLQAPETGFLTGLKLENGETVAGDFFFDCTGFAALLFDRTLGVPYIDWSHWLPCDSVHAVGCRHEGPLTPYTRATAKTAGWQWRIPTQSRTGNGHVYAREFMSDDEAVSVLLKGVTGEVIGSPRTIRFKTGRRQEFWKKNCIAIGLSAGFVEPLESTSLWLIQEGISKFIYLFPYAATPDVIRDQYNSVLRSKFEQVRDFIVLHYFATERDDSPFWNYCRNMSIPDSLKDKIALFREGGRIFRYQDELFSEPSWVAVFLGQNIVPKVCDPIVANLPPEDVRRSVDSMHTAMLNAASKMPTHEEFIKRYCDAGAM